MCAQGFLVLLTACYIRRKIAATEEESAGDRTARAEERSEENLLQDPKLKKLRMNNMTGVKQAEQISFEQETKLQIWKSRIIDVYQKYTGPSHRNVTKEEVSTMKSLREK